MTNVFLDLDGTLTDPKPGITGAFIYAMERLGLPAPHADELDWVIGPALVDSFARLGVADPELALAHYRERYTDTGLFENRVYDGVIEMLEALRATGHLLCLATAKPHAYATRITAHFGLAPYLAHEFGPELDGTRNDKGELLAYALERLNLVAADCIMIGDRHHDIDAALKVGMRSIAVSWGYGAAEEHGRADGTCSHPREVPGLMKSLGM